MAVQETKGVGTERYGQGLTYEQFLAQAKVNVDLFRRWLDDFRLTPADAATLRGLKRKGVTRMLALAEDWCPDVYRGLPVFKRVSEDTGIDLRVFPRDQNLDIMGQFLNQGQFQSIPTVVFYTEGMEYLGHWIERPALANQERVRIEAEVRASMPGAQDTEVRKVVREKTQARWPAWQQATIKEVIALLEQWAGR